MADAPIAPAAEPVVVEAVEPVDRLAALSREDLATWRQTGKLPEPAPAEPADDDEGDDAPEERPAATTPVAPVAEPPKISKRQAHINELERRAKAAEIERDELKARLAQSASVPAAAPSAPLGTQAAPAGEGRDGAPPAASQPLTGPQPKLKTFVEQIGEKYEDYEEALEAHAIALSTWQLDERDARAAITQAQTRAEQIGREQFDAYLARETAFKATVPDFDQKTAAVRQAIDIRTPLGSALVSSEVAPQLLNYFADHPAEFQRIGALGLSNLPAALRALWRLEHQLEAGSTAPAAPTPKTVSSAPAPPTILGTRPADPGDEARAAVARGDFRAFKEAEDRKAAARVKAGMR